MARLEARSVSARYGRHQVLFDVDLPDVADGEIIGLIGPNASGKSTLMRRLSGEIAGDGRILLDGRDQAAYRHSDWYDRVASMPQAPPEPSALLPTELMWSTARALSLELSDAELGAAIERVFDGLGLSDAALSPLHTLSGGKRQLVGLAMALIRDPDLLLLDEPTSALDLHWRMVVLDTVRERLRTQGGAAVAALHDLDLAARYCDHIALIHHGRVVAAGSPGEVLTTDNLAAVYRVEAEVAMDDQGRPTTTVLRPIR